jgi:hypothetical protein
MEWAQQPLPCIMTLGFLLFENDDYVVLTDSVADGTAQEDCGSLWKIPKKWIKQRKELT